MNRFTYDNIRPAPEPKIREQVLSTAKGINAERTPDQRKLANAKAAKRRSARALGSGSGSGR